MSSASKLILLLVPLFAATIPSAFADCGQTTGSEFDNPNDECSRHYYTDDEIYRRIESDVQIACSADGLCTISAITSNGQKFDTSLNVGYGSQNQGGSGTVVVVPGGGYGNQDMGAYVGVTLSYSRARCTQEVKVPKSLYIAMNTYLYRLIKEDGGTRTTFTPAEQTMILFYSTILKQAKGCSGVTG